MKKTVFMSLAAVSALSANEIDEAFGAGKASGNIRTVYIDQNNDASADTYTTAIGGILKYETAAWHDLKLGIGGYISQKIVAASGSGEDLNYDFLSADNDSFAYVGEAYVDYSANGVSIRIGRQLLDTPFADTDDIRMVPNTFEAAIATFSGIDKTTLVGGYVTRWAGYDSGDDISEFKKFDADYDAGTEGESDGAVILGITNESLENVRLQGWFYGVDEVADLYYADAAYAIPLNEIMGLEVSVQAAHFDEKRNTNMNGDVYGLAATFNLGMVSVGAAYNRGSNGEGEVPPIGFGGGPYFTSMEEWTIEGMEDGIAYQLNAGLDMASLGAEGLSFTALYGEFKSDAGDDVKVKEFDIIAAYEIEEGILADISYATINDCNDNADGGADAGYDRFLARLSYNF